MLIATGDPGHYLRLASKVCLAHVQQHQDGLLGQEAETAERFLFVLPERDRPKRRPSDERFVQSLQEGFLAVVGLSLRRWPVVAARLEALQSLLHDRQVGERELQVEALEIAPRIDGTVRMGHRRVFEGPDYV